MSCCTVASLFNKSEKDDGIDTTGVDVTFWSEIEKSENLKEHCKSEFADISLKLQKLTWSPAKSNNSDKR